jgi:predicted enzyme related to lactoylglutathione lyase
MLKQLSTLMVYVGDMPRAVSFYRDVLGLPLQVESPGWSQFDLGNGAIIGLHVGHPAGSGAGWIPGFEVDDIRAADQRVRAAGASIDHGFHDVPGGVVLEFKDPDGNPVQVTQMGVTCADLGLVST